MSRVPEKRQWLDAEAGDLEGHERGGSRPLWVRPRSSRTTYGKCGLHQEGGYAHTP